MTGICKVWRQFLKQWASYCIEQQSEDRRRLGWHSWRKIKSLVGDSDTRKFLGFSPSVIPRILMLILTWQVLKLLGLSLMDTNNDFGNDIQQALKIIATRLITYKGVPRNWPSVEWAASRG